MKKSSLCLLTLVTALVFCGCNKTSNGNDSAFLHGKGAPSNSIGENYSHYYDEESRFIYEKNDGVWINKYAIGSDHLYTQSQKKNAKMKKELSDDNEKNVVSNALSNSFYSTNISFEYAYVDSNDQVNSDTWRLAVKVDKELTQIQSPDIEEFNEYLRSNAEGHEVLVDGNFEKITDINPNLLTMVPFPSIDNITFSNFGIYQEDLGQMTSIVIANINNAYFDEESGYYKFDQIDISHQEIDSSYITEANTLSFSFSIKLSENQEYVETAYFKILSSTIYPLDLFENNQLKISFYDYHTTSIELPE